MRRQSSHWILYVFCCVYQFLGLCFALKVAPLAFQKVMHHVLGGLESEHVLIYLDDCLILTSSLDKHLETIEKMIYCFKNAGLILRPYKCHFFLDNINFLGFKSEQRIQPGYKRLTTIKDYPIPMIWEGSDHFWDFAHLYFYVLDIKLLRYHWANCLNQSDTFRIPLPNLLFNLYVDVWCHHLFWNPDFSYTTNILIATYTGLACVLLQAVDHGLEHAITSSKTAYEDRRQLMYHSSRNISCHMGYLKVSRLCVCMKVFSSNQPKTIDFIKTKMCALGIQTKWISVWYRSCEWV